MNADDREADETVVVSRRARRRAAEQAGDAEPPPVAEDDAFAHEATVVVDRSRSGDASVAEDDAFAHEATVVVDRARPADASVAEDDPFAHEATVVVDRARSADAPVAEDDRPADDSGEEDAHPEDATVAVPRRRPRLLRRRDARPAEPELATFDDSFPADTVPRSTVTFARPEGPAVPSIYKPRPAPLVPSAPPVLVAGAPAPTRIVEASRPSVAKAAVRESRLALLAVAGACVVSVAGLVGVVLLVLP